MMSQEALQESHHRIRSIAVALAGQPGDIAQRVVVHHQLYDDSRGNHAFPLMALHGALWGYRFFEVTGKLGSLISYRYFYDEAQRRERHAMLDRFAEGFKTINRAVFIDTYTNYMFTRQHGRERDAGLFLQPELLEALNRCHEAREAGSTLDEAENKSLFQLALRYEQECTVAPGIASEIEKFDCPILRALCLKPVVRFAYFPTWKHFYFGNFSDKAERVASALEAYDLAVEVGWPEVLASMREYEVLPTAFFDDPRAHFSQLYAQRLQ